MVRLPALLMSTFLLVTPLSAETAASRLDAVADDLAQIVTDLEATQAQTEGLKTRLVALETLTAGQQATLALQEGALDRYRESVAALEAHDRQALALAEDLRAQLESERRISSWLWPIAGVALGVAVVEGFLLVVLQ